jgi:hypothetical protein
MKNYNEIENYLNDGAGELSQAVLAYLKRYVFLGDEDVIISISRWENCREQGYVLKVVHCDTEKLNLFIIFYEHRNSDNICVKLYRRNGIINNLNIDIACADENFMKDKYDFDKSFAVDEASEAAKYIAKVINDYIDEKEEKV